MARLLGCNVTFHGLRHTHVSMLIKAGVPINTISARVGHSTPSITHDIYAHLLSGMGRYAMGLFEKMLLSNDKLKISIAQYQFFHQLTLINLVRNLTPQG